MRIALIIFLTIIGAILLRQYGEYRYFDGASTAFDYAAWILKRARKEMTDHETAKQAITDAEEDIANGVNSPGWSGFRHYGGPGNSPDDETPGSSKSN